MLIFFLLLTGLTIYLRWQSTFASSVTSNDCIVEKTQDSEGSEMLIENTLLQSFHWWMRTEFRCDWGTRPRPEMISRNPAPSSWKATSANSNTAVASSTCKLFRSAMWDVVWLTAVLCTAAIFCPILLSPQLAITFKCYAFPPYLSNFESTKRNQAFIALKRKKERTKWRRERERIKWRKQGSILRGGGGGGRRRRRGVVVRPTCWTSSASCICWCWRTTISSWLNWLVHREPEQLVLIWRQEILLHSLSCHVNGLVTFALQAPSGSYLVFLLLHKVFLVGFRSVCGGRSCSHTTLQAAPVSIWNRLRYVQLISRSAKLIFCPLHIWSAHLPCWPHCYLLSLLYYSPVGLYRH